MEIKNQKEVRYLPARELRVAKADDGTRTLSGYAAVFNSLSVDMGGWKEQLSPGCFSKSLLTNPDVRCLRDHDNSILLGRTTSKTLTLSEDSTGLKFSCDLPNTTQANDLGVLIDRGDISGCSFGFLCNLDNWTHTDDGQTVRTLIDVDLFDVSIVSEPAYLDTSVSLRSAPAEIRSAIEQRAKKTKSVDGEELPASSFLIVLDKNDTSTWNLPWKFSTEEKTVSHLRDALARFDQLEDVPANVKDKAWDKLTKLCKKYGIDVQAKRSKADATDPTACDCYCDPCIDGDCDGCINDDCSYEMCSCPSATENFRNRAHMLLELARHRAK